MKVLKIVLIVIIFAGILIGGYFYYQKVVTDYGFLILKINPLSVTIDIDGTNYQVQNGYLKLRLKPGQYNITISSSNCYPEKKIVVINKNSVTELEPINLLPIKWTTKTLIEDSNIALFKINDQSNLIVYLSLINKKYNWYLYNRAQKSTQKFYQSSNLPLNIIFTNDNKKILVEMKPQEWWILFMSNTLLNNNSINLSNGLNLNNGFIEELKKQQTLKKDFKIKEILATNNEDEVIVNTNIGIYRYNYLAPEIEQIFDDEVSPILLDNNVLYFIQKNGLLTKLDLANNNLENISLFKFYNNTEDLNKIKLFKNQKNDFVITNSSHYLFINNTDNNANLPQKLDFEFNKVAFNNKDLILFFDSNSKNTIIYNTKEQTQNILKITPDDLPQWFLNDYYLLFTVNNNLVFYDWNKEMQYSIKEGLKNNLYYYDSRLNYIFYLDNEGVKMISY